MAYGIVCAVAVLSFLVPSIGSFRSTRRLKVKPHYARRLFTGWFLFGVSVAAVGVAIVLALVEKTSNVTAYIMAPAGVLGMLWLLERYLPDVYSFQQTLLEETLEFCVDFFGAARRSLTVVSGWLAAEFYGNEKILEALEAAKQRGVEIQILFQYESRPTQAETRKKLLKFLELGTNLIPLTGPVPGPHFMVVDGRHSRVEANHHAVARDSRGVSLPGLSNTVHYWSPISAWGLRRRFSALRQGDLKLD